VDFGFFAKLIFKSKPPFRAFAILLDSKINAFFGVKSLSFDKSIDNPCEYDPEEVES
jgi:hypothetical protein